jgi:tight adherence protein B
LTGALAVACVLAIVWPSGAARRRLRVPAAEPRFALPAVDVSVMRARLESRAVRRPRQLVALVALAAAIVGWIVGGPVAAMVGIVYGALAARAVARRIAKQRDTAARARHLDDLCALAADLRAGLPPATAADLHPATRPLIHGSGRELSLEASGIAATRAPNPSATAVSKHAIHGELRIIELTAAVWRLAEHTGAPAADLVERIEADARATDRAQASAAAQAAGAQATALLLAALPLGGIALGYAIGADPLRVLLHTPLGGACAAAAVLLQCAGLFWADRLTNGPIR